MTLSAILHGLFQHVKFSTGALTQKAIKWYAIADAMAALRQGPMRADSHWRKPSAGYGISFIAIGWLCPVPGNCSRAAMASAGHSVLIYIGLFFLIGLPAAHDVIAASTADKLIWLALLVQWIAALEAPLAMRKFKVI